MNKYDITNKVVSAFTLYKFVQEITKPFTSFKAYRDGIIDREGYFLIPVEELDKKRINISTFELFIIYLKRLFDQIPNPFTKASLRSTTAALSLFKESLDDYDLDSNLIITGILDHVIEDEKVNADLMNEINEMAPVNSMGGAFSNPQVGTPGGLAGYSPVMGMAILRRSRKRKRTNPLSFMSKKKAKDA